MASNISKAEALQNEIAQILHSLKTSSPPEASAEPIGDRESQLHCSCPPGSHTQAAHDASPKRLVTSGPELGTTQRPLYVHSSLMARYNREDLYEVVWTVPMRNLAKQYGVSDVALAKTSRKREMFQAIMRITRTAGPPWDRRA
jgi:hypothetical protein